jgi:hypothetical protein
VAVDWSAGVSDEIGEYYRDSLTLWLTSQFDGLALQADARPGASWFFGFPYAFPVTRLRFYGWGDLRIVASPAEAEGKSRAFNGWTSPHYWEPSTEQFYGMAQTRDPIKFAYIDPQYFLGCDEDGRLWCYGNGINPGSAFTNPPRRPLSAFGLDDDFLPVFPTPVSRVSRGFRRVHIPVYGDKGDIASQRIIKTGSALLGTSAMNFLACFALSDENELWIAGRTLDVFEDGAIQTDETDTPPSDLRFFRRMSLSVVFDEYMEQVTLNEPLKIKDFWAIKSLLVLTVDGDLYLHNGTHPRYLLDRKGFYKVSGFVNSVEITNGGSGYTSNPSVEVSAPASPNGSSAIFEIQRTNEQIVGIRIVHPGSGYGDSPPTITFTGGGGSGAAATCTVFNEKWISASLSESTQQGQIAAISESGELYTWGNQALWGEDSSIWRSNLSPSDSQFYFNSTQTSVPNPDGGFFQFNGYPFPVKAWNPSQVVYDFVSVGSFGLQGVLLSADGTVSYWGSFGFFGINGTPNLEMAHYPRLLSDVTEIGNKKFLQVAAGDRVAVLLDEDGIAYTYGTGGASSWYLGQGYLPSHDGSIGPVAGDARWKKVFASAGIGNFGNVLATRDEAFDADGNRLNPLPPINAS